MRRTIIALSLLGLLAALSTWNLRHIDTLTDRLCGCVELSMRCMDEGDGDAARAAVDAALMLWEEAEGYTHIFVRHSEVDGAADALFALQSAVHSQNVEESRAMGNAALYHLRSIQGMEHPGWGSIF